MGLFSFKKEKPILNPEDIAELNEIQRQSYMQKARELMKQRGEKKAEQEILPKKDSWNLNG